MSITARINAQRLWQSLETFATFGATPAGGVTRLTLSEEDRQGRDTLKRWAAEAGFSCEIDELGSMFIRRPGKNAGLAPVMICSHADSQPQGGNYDGVYGVLAGLEVLRTLNDHEIQTERDILLVNWTNEEGARFAPAMLASGVWAGVFSKAFALSRLDSAGISVAEALETIGYQGRHKVQPIDLHACYELHIEQGPILEETRTDIGIVHAAMGQRWFEVTLQGFAAHAGTTPMDLRQDAMCGFAEIVLAVEKIAQQSGKDGRGTIGMSRVVPNSRNVVPGEVFFTVEFRHPESKSLEVMESGLHDALNTLSHRHLTVHVEKIFDYAPIKFDQCCVSRIEKAVEHLEFSQSNMVSGAGHDACYIQRVAPTAIIFIPCVKGISHNEAEAILPEWSEKGANTLFRTIIIAANESE
ncbi:Zn-dependent hydrolase [Candidatus Pantoea floridensis]|uniref:N-carbamoyl-L-amino-acid hydrolase n=1 Tax=Candidatus Pantoea floridensis TaxID=1938870 RepID=A0A286BXZ3_9GAMM|nr:Zn-dependent hydrolase [Pantoea floridensis]PIF21518.1 N-carbamoyl-L-amino-acid hydrolase [Enterobacteriaceae bacterium JKS000233]SOD39029.1 N-carbamoyl-L-amino-acid hydrolase [Pantoea floridensis]